jgi:hypothetical protein
MDSQVVSDVLFQHGLVGEQWAGSGGKWRSVTA